MGLTDQEINTRIAEACGWEKVADEFYIDGIAFVRLGYRIASCDLPNYCTDLNAIIAIMPNGIEFQRWRDGLWRLAGDWRIATLRGSDLARLCCEYFLRNLGKWKEPTP